MYFVFLSWCNEIICTGFRRHARGRFGHVEYKWVVRQLLSYLKYCHISALIIIITINNIIIIKINFIIIIINIIIIIIIIIIVIFTIIIIIVVVIAG